MSGYIEAGYVIVLVSLATYSVSVVVRERAAKRRLSAPPATGDTVTRPAAKAAAAATVPPADGDRT